MMDMTVILTFKCSGGLELLCDSVKIHNVSIDLENGVGKVSHIFQLVNERRSSSVSDSYFHASSFCLSSKFDVFF